MHLPFQEHREILSEDDRKNYDVICLCRWNWWNNCRTSLKVVRNQQQILGFSALKANFYNAMFNSGPLKPIGLTDAYCCGGYAKLLMNYYNLMVQFEQQYAIPLNRFYR